MIGKFKDECSFVHINEFVGLGLKMYSYIKENQQNGKTCKGVKRNVIKQNIHHEDYKNVLFNNQQIYHKMKTIRSEKHELASYELNKVSLSCFDDKRYINENGVKTFAYGHIKFKNIKIKSDKTQNLALVFVYCSKNQSE